MKTLLDDKREYWALYKCAICKQVFHNGIFTVGRKCAQNYMNAIKEGNIREDFPMKEDHIATSHIGMSHFIGFTATPPKKRVKIDWSQIVTEEEARDKDPENKSR